MTQELRALWEQQPDDPDPEVDLGYQVDPLTMIDGADRGDQVIFLPAEEQQLQNDEFIVTRRDTPVSLAEWR
jgi:hypothetical protein